jgi:hypothetical protein
MSIPFPPEYLKDLKHFEEARRQQLEPNWQVENLDRFLYEIPIFGSVMGGAIGAPVGAMFASGDNQLLGHTLFGLGTGAAVGGLGGLMLALGAYIHRKLTGKKTKIYYTKTPRPIAIAVDV